MTEAPFDRLSAARQIAALVERAVAEERLACAAVAEALGPHYGDAARQIAAAIRARNTSAQAPGTAAAATRR
jgi:hypothetical protein